MPLTVVVTGSSGYIGGQTVLALKDAGHVVVGVDNRPTPSHLSGVLNHFCCADFSSAVALDFMFMHKPDAIIHCAGTSLVGPSVLNPELYYQNNFVATKTLLDAIVANNLQQQIRIIFSSSASIYGEPIMVPCNEEDPPMPMSPYGESKLMVEMLMQSYYRAYNIQPVMFRYFNACGADSQTRHGQEPGATHIIARVLESIRDNKDFELYGSDYSTVDGTCVRDYVHVEDIAQAHVLAISNNVPTGVYNLGSNEGTSIKQILDKVQELVGKLPNVVLGQRRAGDPATLTASPERFESVVGSWRQYNVDDMIKHAWNWYVR